MFKQTLLRRVCVILFHSNVYMLRWKILIDMSSNNTNAQITSNFGDLTKSYKVYPEENYIMSLKQSEHIILATCAEEIL